MAPMACVAAESNSCVHALPAVQGAVKSALRRTNVDDVRVRAGWTAMDVMRPLTGVSVELVCPFAKRERPDVCPTAAQHARRKKAAASLCR